MLVQEASKVLGPGAYRGYLWRLEYDWEQPVGDHRLATWQPLATYWRPTGDLLATWRPLATDRRASSHSIHWRPAGDLLATWRPGDLATWRPLATYWRPTGDFYWRPGDPGLKEGSAGKPLRCPTRCASYEAYEAHFRVKLA